MPRIDKLVVACALVWVVALVLALYIGAGGLGFGATRLAQALSGRVGNPADMETTWEALDETDLDRRRRQLERALSIDPNNTVAGRALVGLLEGDDESVRRHCEALLKIDPFTEECYVALSSVVRFEGNAAGARAILEDGARRFEERARAYRPIVPERVDPESDKAWLVYRKLSDSAARLHTAAAAL